MPRKTPPPMQALPAEAAVSRASGRTTAARPRRLPTDARPEDVLELVRRYVGKDQIGKARQLLAKAARRFPDHPQIRSANRVLAEARATPNPFVQATASAEIEWLREPPVETRGKWVALIGSKLVGMADSAEELMEALRPKRFEQLPVVQYIAP